MGGAGQVVVVTGGASGIGAALCRAFAAAGATVVVADLDGPRAQAVADEVGGTSAAVDVRREEDVSALVARTLDRSGAVDVYCSNAGVAVAGGVETPDSAWQLSWEVHVMAHVYAARALLPAMLDRGGGAFIATVSAAALLNHLDSAPYAVTKAAALSFLEWMAITYGDRGVRVSALCPQGVRTPMLAQAGDGHHLWEGALDPAEVAAAVVAALDDERFLILPHPEVAEFFGRKATDYDRWLRGMRRLRAQVILDPARAASPGEASPAS